MQTQDNTQSKTDTSSDCLSASELVRRHLQDKNHEISEDDLKKVALDCNDDTDVQTPVMHFPDATSQSMNTVDLDENTDKDEDKKEEKDVIITPLDVLS
jgi:hypothetical protein